MKKGDFFLVMDKNSNFFYNLILNIASDLDLYLTYKHKTQI